MFERYTEKARRVIFFARYEAAQFGAPQIEPEHILLGIIREDFPLMQRLSGETFTDPVVRKQVEDATGVRLKISASADLPLSTPSKRVLAYAAQEADRLCSTLITPEHLLSGLMLEKGSLANLILTGHGLRFEAISGPSLLSPEQQHRWKASRIRWQRIHAWAYVAERILTLVFAVLFLQIFAKTNSSQFTHFDAIFYLLTFPTITALIGGLAYWRHRRKQLMYNRAVRYLVIMTAVFFAAMGMIFAGIRP